MDLPNPNRIDLDNPADVMLWSDMLSITTEQLIEIVQKIGPMSAAVRFYATRLGAERRPAKAPVSPVEANFEQAMA